MFVHQHQLEHLLEPRHYSSVDQHQRELNGVMRPAWHLAGSVADLPRHGDYRTFELFGEPILLRNEQGSYHAFLNVCSHRHCLISSQPCGNAPTIRCQYHGWEYTKEGRTGKIPEAVCFRPFDRENARLHKFPLELCGDLIFVSTCENPPPLEEFLGDIFAIVQDRFSPPYKQNWSWEFSFNCNWKLPLENTMESYHILEVHPKSFGGIYPTEPAMTHVIKDAFSSLTYDVTEDKRASFWQRWAVKSLGGVTTDRYLHHVIYPNQVLVLSDSFAYFQAYLPTSPTTSRTILRMVTLNGPRKNPYARMVALITAHRMKKDVQAIMLEDAYICEQQQRGLASSRFRGCIGTREERIFAFHKYLLDKCGDGMEVDEMKDKEVFGRKAK